MTTVCLVCCPQAENKGATATEYGLVFGVFELVVFIISPIYGQHVSNKAERQHIRSDPRCSSLENMAVAARCRWPVTIALPASSRGVQPMSTTCTPTSRATL